MTNIVKPYSTVIPLEITEDDPLRPQIEGWLETLDRIELHTVFWTTRKAAAVAKGQKDMEQVYLNVRASKTIQRIAGDKGVIIDHYTGG